jgi:hypothetical protein
MISRIVLILPVLLVILAFEVAMFIDMLHNERITQQNKVIWAAAMLLVNPFVAIYYFFTAHNQ